MQSAVVGEQLVVADIQRGRHLFRQRQGVAPVQQRLQEALQRCEQAAFVTQRLALAPERVAFVEQADLGAVEVAPVEHLDAVRPPHGQDQPEVLAFQGVAIQLQGAVAIALAAQVLEQARQVGQALVADRLRRHFQQVVLLADLQQVAARLAAKQLPVGFAEQLFDPHGDGGGPVATEAAHHQFGWLRRASGLFADGVEELGKALGQRLGACVMAHRQFVPAVEAELVEGQHQVVAHPGITEHVGTPGSHVQVHLAVVAQRVDTDVDQQQDALEPTRLQQVGVVHGRQGDRQELPQAAQEIVQFGIAEVALAGMQGQPGGAVDDAVAMAPGEQLDQPEAAFQRRVVRPLVSAQGTGEDRPLRLLAVVVGGQLDQGQDVFAEIRGDPRVDVLHLACLALEGGIQAAAEQAQVAAVDAAVSALLAGDLEQQAVAVGQFVDHRATLFHHLAHLPLAAAVEQGQAARLPLPFHDEPLHRQVLPALLRLALATAELAPDLEVQAAPHEFQAFRRLLFPQVAFEMAIDQDVGVQFVEIELAGEYLLLEAQGDAADPRVLAGVGFGEQQLEQRLVGRIDGLGQLPEAGADELPGGDVRQVAEVEHLFGADEAFAEQGPAVFVVAPFMGRRHQPP